MCVSLWVLGKTWIRSAGGCQGEKNHINHYARLHCLYSHGWCGGQTENAARTTKDAMTGGNIHWHWMSWNHRWMSTPNKWLITRTLLILLRIHGDTLKATRLKKLNIHKKTMHVCRWHIVLSWKHDWTQWRGSAHVGGAPQIWTLWWNIAHASSPLL
jgi:hypothetical protein